MFEIVKRYCLILLIVLANLLFADDNDSLLIQAIESGNNQHVYDILRQGYNPNVRSRNGLTPLMTAVMKKNDNVVTTLLAFGADTDTVDDAQNSALHLAAQNENEKILKKLIEYDANADKTNFFGLTPLSIAVLYNQPSAVELIIKANADLTIKSNEGYNAVQYSVILERWEIMKIFANYSEHIPFSMINSLYQTIYNKVNAEEIAEIFQNLEPKESKNRIETINGKHEVLPEIDHYLDRKKSIHIPQVTEEKNIQPIEVNSNEEETNLLIQESDDKMRFIYVGDYQNIVDAERVIQNLQKYSSEQLLEKSYVQKKNQLFSLFLGPFSNIDLTNNKMLHEGFAKFEQEVLQNLESLVEIKNNQNHTSDLQHITPSVSEADKNNINNVYYLDIKYFKNCAMAMEALFTLQDQFPFFDLLNNETVSGVEYCTLRIGYVDDQQLLKNIMNVLPINIKNNSIISYKKKEEIDLNQITNAEDLQNALTQHLSEKKS